MGASRVSMRKQETQVEFTFNGQPLLGVESDTVASALRANGIVHFGTSPQSGEPYGGFCFVGRCAECLVMVDGQPGVMACRTTLEPSMSVQAQAGRGAWGEGSEG